MKKVILLVVLSLISLALIAEEDLLAKLDSDNDGLISMEEAKVDSTLSAIFTELDINQDGFLSHLELDVNTEDETH